jgi:hypothetical protein
MGDPALDVDEAAGRRKFALCPANCNLPHDETDDPKQEDQHNEVRDVGKRLIGALRMSSTATGYISGFRSMRTASA